EEIVKAWKDSGARVGWVRPSSTGFWKDVGAEERKAGDLPAFILFDWREGLLAKLPDPARPFALYLYFYPFGTEMTDAGLKELAELKRLQWLGLSCSSLTDGGLKDLARLKSLQSLDLGGTKVTGTGLKELAELKDLQALQLSHTKVTDAGLKELAGLK